MFAVVGADTRGFCSWFVVAVDAGVAVAATVNCAAVVVFDSSKVQAFQPYEGVRWGGGG